MALGEMGLGEMGQNRPKSEMLPPCVLRAYNTNPQQLAGYKGQRARKREKEGRGEGKGKRGREERKERGG